MKGKIVFMGTPDFAVESLDAIVQAGYEVGAVVTVPDRPTGRGQKLTASPVKQYAEAHGLPLLQPERLRDAAFIDSLRQVGADLFVVVAFRMLPQVVWAMPPRGTFNLHASLLPQYRGAAPINWAIINGETESGVTTFLLNERIDEGQILLQRATPIADNETAGSLHDRLAAMGARLVVETLDGLFDGTLQGQPQPHTEPLKAAPKIFKADCAIDWHGTGAAICRHVRGLSPYPAATCEWRDEKGQTVGMKVYEAECEQVGEGVLEGDNYRVGGVLTDGKKELKIAVSDGFVKILSLQVSGKKRIRVDEFLRGYSVSDWKLIV